MRQRSFNDRGIVQALWISLHRCKNSLTASRPQELLSCRSYSQRAGEVGGDVLEQPRRRGAAGRVPGAGVLHALYDAAAGALRRRGARGGDRPADALPLVAHAAAGMTRGRGRRSSGRGPT
jgi:hypothetical protein